MCLKQSIDALAISLPSLVSKYSNVHKIYSHIQSAISESFVIKEISGISYKGSYNLESETITIKSDLDEVLKIRTLLHETAHALDFTMAPIVNIPRNQHELIAESSAYIVLQKMGFDTTIYSVNYLKSWMTDNKELTAILQRIHEISYRMIMLLAEADASAFSITEESEEKTT